jgi:hypothetical protein
MLRAKAPPHPPELMSLEEVWALEHINANVAREAYSQVTQRLADVLEAKKSFEQKALSLFAGYVTLTLASFGLAVGAAGATSPLHGILVPLCGVGILTTAGAFMFVLALWDADYGSLGSAPESWLRRDVLTSLDDQIVAKVTASVVRRCHERIAVSVTSNARKARFIRAGMLLGVIAPISLLVYVLL